MPEATVQSMVACPIVEVWRYVDRFDNWAPLMPGFQSLQHVDSKKSIWTLKSDVGIFQRAVRFEVHLTERHEPERIEFRMNAIDERLEGGGSFQARALDASNTEFTLILFLEMGGMLRPVGNALLESMLPRDARSLAESVRLALEERMAVAPPKQTKSHDQRS